MSQELDDLAAKLRLAAESLPDIDGVRTVDILDAMIRTAELDDRRRDLATRALAKWGELLQLVKAGEELSGCSAAVSRVAISEMLADHTAKSDARDREVRFDLAIEIADAEIVLEQLRQIYKQRCEDYMLDNARAVQLAKLRLAIDAGQWLTAPEIAAMWTDVTPGRVASSAWDMGLTSLRGEHARMRESDRLPEWSPDAVERICSDLRGLGYERKADT